MRGGGVGEGKNVPENPVKMTSDKMSSIMIKCEPPPACMERVKLQTALLREDNMVWFKDL